MAAELSAILAMARRVQEVDTAGVIPAAQTITQPAALREDEVQPSLPANRVFKRPAREKTIFACPRLWPGMRHNYDFSGPFTGKGGRSWNFLS